MKICAATLGPSYFVSCICHEVSFNHFLVVLIRSFRSALYVSYKRQLLIEELFAIISLLIRSKPLEPLPETQFCPAPLVDFMWMEDLKMSDAFPTSAHKIVKPAAR